MGQTISPSQQNQHNDNPASANSSVAALNRKAGARQKQLKPQFYLKKQSLKLVKLENDEGVYQLQFEFDCTSQCKVSIYVAAIETRDSSNGPAYFLTDKTKPDPQTHNFQPGMNQKFDNMMINVNDYNPTEIFRFESDFYPLIIQMEGQCDGSFEKCKILTYFCFQSSAFDNYQQEEQLFKAASAKSDPSYQQNIDKQCRATISQELKIIKQLFLYKEKVFILYDVFGIFPKIVTPKQLIQNSSQDLEEQKVSAEVGPPLLSQDSKQQRECIVCLTNLKEIICFPCGHYSVCQMCFKSLNNVDHVAQERDGNVKQCPICRSKIYQYTTLKESEVEFNNSDSRAMMISNSNINNDLI